MVNAGSAVLFVIFYTICLLASKFSRRPFYKRMWGTAAFVLGGAITLAAGIYLVEVLACLAAF